MCDLFFVGVKSSKQAIHESVNTFVTRCFSQKAELDTGQILGVHYMYASFLKTL